MIDVTLKQYAKLIKQIKKVDVIARQPDTIAIRIMDTTTNQVLAPVTENNCLIGFKWKNKSEFPNVHFKSDTSLSINPQRQL